MDSQSFLDGLYDLAAALIEDGAHVDLDSLLGGREHLREAAQEVVRLAREVTFAPARPIEGAPGYTILRELGQGGMGTVYLARQERLGRDVALKVLPRSAALSGRARGRFLAEARAIASLRHPNIVAIHDVIESGIYAYAMEWVDGMSLAGVVERLRAGAAAPGEPCEPNVGTVRAALGTPEGLIAESSYAVFVARLGVAIARALAAVHGAGLVHRDVKPSNILIRRDGTPLLSDFGLVRETDTTIVTQHGEFAGTPMYAPPEQLRGEHNHVDARSDVYSLGATLYHALTLRAPFDAGSPSAMLRRVEGGAADPIRRIAPRVPRDLETIIAKAMQPDSARRYASASDLADDLERMLNLQPIRARRIGALGRAIRSARRNRAAFAGAVLGGALVGAAGVALVLLTVMMPRWSREHRRAGQLSLFQVLQADDLAKWVAGEVPEADPNATRALIDAALPELEAAARWGALDASLKLERDAVRAARAIGAAPGGARERVPEGLTPLAREYARAWIEGGSAPAMSITADAEGSDVRALGLIAFLCKDPRTAVEAWTRHDPNLNPDPFIDATLGELYLSQDQPMLAYPRLANAVEHYGDVRFLLVELADAALGSGDVGAAQRLLTKASALDQPDPYFILDRVRADLNATRCLHTLHAAESARAGGDDAAAAALKSSAAELEFLAEIGAGDPEDPTPVRMQRDRRIKGYTFFTDFRQNPTARDHYARFLIARGRLKDAIDVYRALITIRPGDVRWRQRFVAAADLWWGMQDARARFRLMLGGLNGEAWFVRTLREYLECRASGRVGATLIVPTLPAEVGGSARRSGPHGFLTRVNALGSWEAESTESRFPVGFTTRGGSKPASLIERLTLSEVGARMEIQAMLFPHPAVLPDILKRLVVASSSIPNRLAATTALVALATITPLAASRTDDCDGYRLIDEFEGPILDPAWTVEFRDADGWTYAFQDGALVATEVDATVQHTGGGGPWAVVDVHREIPAVGDFDVSIDLKWDEANDPEAMQKLLLEVRDVSGSRIAVVGFNDAWAAWSGEIGAWTSSQGYHSGWGTALYADSGVARVQRVDGVINCYWKGQLLLTASDAEPATEVAVLFGFYDLLGGGYDSFFGTETVGWIDLCGSPLCRADFDSNGTVDSRDVLAFLNAWTAQDDRADFSGDGTIDTRDVLAFLNAWTAGCA